MFQASITPEEIEGLRLAAFNGLITVIDHDGKEMEEAIDYLGKQKVIGFDTESRPTFSSGQPHYGVSLLQLAGAEKAFLFRIKLLGMDERLCRILSDDKIIKVGAAVGDDIRGLQRYRKFIPGNFVDLQKIVWEYGIRDKSVKKMSAIILGFRISKTQQLSNWEAETLSGSQQLYAATDAWVCREMYSILMDSEKNPLIEEKPSPAKETVQCVKYSDPIMESRKKRRRISPKEVSASKRRRMRRRRNRRKGREGTSDDKSIS